MSLFDKLPLDLSEIIYKISLEDHVANILENVIQFHLKNGKKRNTYVYIKYTKVGCLSAEIQRLVKVVNDNKPSKTIKEFQDCIFWYNTLCYVILENVDLINKYPTNNNQRLIRIANDKLKSMKLNYLEAFVV